MITTTFRTPREGALFCAARGFKVFPLRSGDKRPQFEAWQDWATNDTTKIENYCVANPTSNWGVYAGGSNLLVIDLDRKEGIDGEAAWLALESQHGSTPTTLTVRTPRGGLHLYTYGKAKNTASALGPGIDTRGYGGYVVAPGSILRNDQGDITGRYTVESDTPVVPTPQWVFALLDDKRLPLDRPDDDKVEGSIGEGRRDTELTRWAGVLRGQGLTVQELEIALLAVNQTRCSPPLHEDQVLKIARSIGRKPRGTAEAVADFASVDVEAALKQSAPKHISAFTGETPTREWVVQDWIPKGEITSIYGSGSVGKSLLSLQLAIAVGTGGKWLGMDTEQMPALYVACEDTDDELHIRRDRILSGPEYEFQRDDVLNAPVFLWSRVGENNDLAIEKDADVIEGRYLPVLRQAITNLEASELLLILDTVSDVYLGSENVREKVNKFLKTILGKLRLDLNLTIILLAHPSRTGMNTGDGLSGSTAWENAVRNRITVTRHETTPDAVVIRRAKSNYARVGDEIVALWDEGRFVVSSEHLTAHAVQVADTMTALAVVCPAPGEYALTTTAKAIADDERTRHLFGGKSWRTVERLIREATETPRVFGGFMYQYFEDQSLKMSKRRIKVAEVAQGSGTSEPMYE